MQLTSPDFLNGGEIPTRFTCDGDDVNPNLEIRGVPEGTQSLALVLDDPDAPSGTFTHWIVWNISAKTEKIEARGIPEGALEGLNSAGRLGYLGPCPPSGKHNYFFTLYALDEVIHDLSPHETDKSSFLERITGHILAQTELIGLYSRIGV